jgi:hypothetical protein
MNATDILDLDFDAHLDRIRRLAGEELIPGETDMVEVGEVPPQLVARLAETGLFGSASSIIDRRVRASRQEQPCRPRRAGPPARPSCG